VRYDLNPKNKPENISEQELQQMMNEQV